MMDMLLNNSNVISAAIAGALGFFVGSIVVTILWLRWFFSPNDMSAIETYANKAWGE